MRKLAFCSFSPLFKHIIIRVYKMYINILEWYIPSVAIDTIILYIPRGARNVRYLYKVDKCVGLSSGSRKRGFNNAPDHTITIPSVRGGGGVKFRVIKPSTKGRKKR